MALGVVLGSWPIPLTLAMVSDGLSGIRSVPFDYLIARLPSSVLENRLWGTVAWFADGALMIAGATVLGILGGRLAAYLIVKQLGWMTAEEFREFSGRDPGI